MKFNENATKEEVVNYMGKKAYKQSPKEELIFAVLTTFIEDSYYENKTDRLDRIKSLVKAADPKFVAKLAVYARTVFHMRSVFAVLIGELSKIHKGTSLVRKAIVQGVTRVDDITEIVSYLGVTNPIPNSVKKGINEALNKFDSYHFAKYRGENKTVKLIDVVNLTHPKATNPKTSEALRKLVKNELRNTDTWESKMSGGQSAASTFNELLDSNKLGYMALLRNLRNIANTGDTNLVKKVAAMISNTEQVKKSKQLPFRFLSAFEALEQNTDSTGVVFEEDSDNTNILKNAVEEALMVSIQNIPLLSGRTLILSDNSGSMHGDKGGNSLTSAYSSRTTASIANLFAVLYWMRSDNTFVGLFGDRLITPKLDRTKSILTNYKTIAQSSGDCGSGTERGIFDAIELLLQEKKKVERIVIFSDCQVGDGCDWYDDYGNRGDNFNKLLKKYQEFNPNVKVYTVNLKGYNNEMTSQGNVMRLTGWSDKIFDIMERNEIAPETMVKEVETIEL